MEEGAVELVQVGAWEKTGSTMDWQAEGPRRKLSVGVDMEVDRLEWVQCYV